MEAKEIFTGFEEPAIDLLPTFPRKRGVAASFSMVGKRSCRDLFTHVDNDNDDDRDRPAYKDRILVHSLDYKKECLTFFSYKNYQAAVDDLRQGNHALRDKRDMREFKIKLVNLDVHLWTYAERDDADAARLPTSFVPAPVEHLPARHRRRPDEVVSTCRFVPARPLSTSCAVSLEKSGSIQQY
ncbi:hypothetical protein PsorP6_012959 [Peronosclerospora sorghi]|uniref:Uncharacterized protein n=1 Tax=Peronosclerospora sorghi TaxID=230839 RepID=A0ACC0WEH6_9STRA|nr:hypothetical protein PsorP6_012959 [Peronosclerospora sorghi]